MKILKGTVFGGIVYFFLGWIMYGILLADFTTNNFNQSTVRPNGEMIWWAIVVSSLIFGFLLTMAMKWSGPNGIVSGLKTGFLFGLLLGLSIDLSNYSMSTAFNNLPALVVDVATWSVIWAAMGLIVALIQGKEKAD